MQSHGRLFLSVCTEIHIFPFFLLEQSRDRQKVEQRSARGSEFKGATGPIPCTRVASSGGIRVHKSPRTCFSLCRFNIHSCTGLLDLGVRVLPTFWSAVFHE